MSILDGLKLTSATKPNQVPVAVKRRNKLSNKLWEQIQLAKSQIEGTEFVVKKYRSVIDKETGLKKQVEVPKRIREWWFMNEEGKVCVSVKYGNCVLELAKGKTSVETDSPKGLIIAMELLKEAVEAGELDSQIELASIVLRTGFKHK